MAKQETDQDFVLQSPAIWMSLAKKMGWEWSPAHGGYINESHQNYMGRTGWAGYFVAIDAEEACFQDGIETLAEALAKLESLIEDEGH